ncbi:GlxA family transcriptional regulator [Chitinophaga sp. HK235]|uniref:GlxA family transcriptional regulator n=1 Tax=Chitinophaga sp. HK235 TaxID=2952571 RepID=UPI001BA6A58F|nr:helix-turn-helix domain-containing protein [Chitinophaga sp. HK235]
MKHISILVPKGDVALSCIEGSFTVFNKVNDFLAVSGKPPLFKVQLVGLARESETYHRLFSVTPDLTLDEVSKTDLIIIPAVNGEMDKVISMNQGFFPWVVAQHQRGAEVASLCVGAFLLASTGLLNGKKCATHWFAANHFRKMFPDVTLVSEKIITDEGGIYSSGGAASFYNLIIYLVEKYAGKELAILCSKMFEIEFERSNQSPFIIFEGQKSHDDEPIRKAQEYIENNFSEKITVDQLATMFSLSRRNLERRFKKATSNTAVEYMQRVKIEAAKNSLETSSENVSEVMYKVGYTDTKAFRTTFKKITGLSPQEYRNKYNRQMAAAS